MAEGNRQKRIERMQRLRTKVVEWSSKHHHEQLESGVRCWLGSRPPSKDKVQEALLFALMAPTKESPSLLERYREAGRQNGRFERQMFEVWKSAWFSVFEISSVTPEEGFQMADVISGESYWVCEKTASKTVSVGDWLATFVKHIDGQMELEGLIVSLVPGTRRAAMETLLGVHRSLAISTGSPETRRCAMDVVAAVRSAEQTLSGEQDTPIVTAQELRKELGLGG